MRAKQIFLLFFTSLLMVGCDYFSIFDDGPTLSSEDSRVDHTMVFYILADNNLSGNMGDNVEAIARAVDKDFAPNGRVVIYYDRRDSTTLMELRANTLDESHWRSRFKVLKRYESQNSASADVMRSVMADVKELAPSVSYGIVISGHGGGWFPNPISSGTTMESQRAPSVVEHDMRPNLSSKPLTRWFGYDGSASDPSAFLSTTDLVNGLSDIEADYLIFDACFMASVEFLYELRHSAKYIMASPTEIMAEGFPYIDIIPLIFEEDASLIDVARAFVDHYTYSGAKHSGSMSVVDCSKLDELATSVKAIYSAGIKDVNLSQVQHLERISSNHAFYDMRDYFELAAPNQELLEGFYKAFDDAVVWSGHTRQIYSAMPWTNSGYITSISNDVMLISLSGLSVYVPREELPTTRGHWHQTSWAQYVTGQQSSWW